MQRERHSCRACKHAVKHRSTATDGARSLRSSYEADERDDGIMVGNDRAFGFDADGDCLTEWRSVLKSIQRQSQKDIVEEYDREDENSQNQNISFDQRHVQSNALLIEPRCGGTWWHACQIVKDELALNKKQFYACVLVAAIMSKAKESRMQKVLYMPLYNQYGKS